MQNNIGASLLDSKLIVTTNIETYDVKLVCCGKYVQLYTFENKKFKKIKNDKGINIKDIDTNNLKKMNHKDSDTILPKNIIRSKLACQRLAKCNSKDWKTFITLTIAENLTDIDKANKRFRYFIDKIQRIDKNIKYLCIPEFQKRGAVHYHLLTNIDINDKRFMYVQDDNPKYKHVKYWIDGFTKVDNVDNNIKKIIGYISKYMTKEIDKRLYSRHRYFYSRNLEKPSVNFLNLNNPTHLEFYHKFIKNKTVIYENQYLDIYTKETIKFQELME